MQFADVTVEDPSPHVRPAEAFPVFHNRQFGIEAKVKDRRALHFRLGDREMCPRISPGGSGQRWCRRSRCSGCSRHSRRAPVAPRPNRHARRRRARVAIERFRIEPVGQLRSPPQRHCRTYDLSRLAGNVPRRLVASDEALVGKIGTHRISAGIQEVERHAPASLSARKTSTTARAVWTSPPLGPSGRGAGRQP